MEPRDYTEVGCFEDKRYSFLGSDEPGEIPNHKYQISNKYQ
jgi:hypothetical protein